jgi:hypothetical protein
MERDLASSGTCFNITANNVTLDCRGYNITGPANDYYADGIHNEDIILQQ